MLDVDLTYLIQHHPNRGGLTVACVKAFCMKESSFREWAHKPEDHYKWLVGDKLTMGSIERSGQKMSWGLMQVMGAVAREYGFKGTFLSELCDPHVGLKYGMIHVQTLFKRYNGHWPDVIAAYNMGSPRRVDGGAYENQESYVDVVLRYWAQYDPTGVPRTTYTTGEVALKESEV